MPFRFFHKLKYEIRNKVSIFFLYWNWDIKQSESIRALKVPFNFQFKIEMEKRIFAHFNFNLKLKIEKRYFFFKFQFSIFIWKLKNKIFYFRFLVFILFQNTKLGVLSTYQIHLNTS